MQGTQRPIINQGRLIDSSETSDEYIISEDQRMFCFRCNAYRYHDIYGSVEGEQIITVKVITHCRDCGFEVYKDPEPIGDVRL